MNDLSRRQFLQATSGGAGFALASGVASAARASAEDQQKPAKFRLGIVTYNIAA
jgi:hypothetical protein